VADAAPARKRRRECAFVDMTSPSGPGLQNCWQERSHQQLQYPVHGDVLQQQTSVMVTARALT
jgi:hypothetical protein